MISRSENSIQVFLKLPRLINFPLFRFFEFSSHINMSCPRQLRKKSFRFDQIRWNGLELEESLVQLLRESKWLVTVEPSISTCLSAVAARPEKLSDNERESGRWNQKGFCSSLCDVIDDLAQDIVPFRLATSLFTYPQRNTGRYFNYFLRQFSLRQPIKNSWHKYIIKVKSEGRSN